jgi:hypothetical protein
MSYPSGPSGAQGGYPGQPPQQPVTGYGPPVQRPNPLSSLSISDLLALVVTVLSLVTYFCTYTSDAQTVTTQAMILLAGGLLAGLQVFPKAPRTLPVAAVFSAVGGLFLLAMVISNSGGTIPTIVIVIMVMGLLQFLAAVGALLFEYDVIKLAPRPAPVNYGQPSGPFPVQPQPHPQATTTFNPAGQPAPPQPTTYAAPVQQQPPGPQATHYMQQPGHISQPGNGSDS